MPRARKPLDVHELQGTTAEYADDQPSVFMRGKPRCPKDLSPVAQAAFKAMVRELARRGTATTADSAALALYAETYARYRGCLDLLNKEGHFITTTWVDKNGDEHSKPIEHPASKLCTRLENSLRQFLKEFSATPASREKSKPAAPGKPKKAEYPVGSMGWLNEQKAKGAFDHPQQPELKPQPEPEPERKELTEDELENYLRL